MYYDMKSINVKFVDIEANLFPIEALSFKADDTSSDDIYDACSVASTAMETTVQHNTMIFASEMKVENNCLYMSWPMNQRFNGLYNGVPTIVITLR